MSLQRLWVMPLFGALLHAVAACSNGDPSTEDSEEGLGGRGTRGGNTGAPPVTAGGTVLSRGGSSTGSGGLDGSGGEAQSGGTNSQGGVSGSAAAGGTRVDSSGGRTQAGSGGATATRVSFDAVATLLEDRCVSCHAGTNDRIDLSSDGGLYARLTTVLPGSVPTCAGRTLVVAGNAASSFLLQKVAASPACGERMPAGCVTSGAGLACLGASDVNLLKTWIEQGATPD